MRQKTVQDTIKPEKTTQIYILNQVMVLNLVEWVIKLKDKRYYNKLHSISAMANWLTIRSWSEQTIFF